MKGEEEAVRQQERSYVPGVRVSWFCALPLTVSCGHFHGFFRNLERRSFHILHALIQRNISSLPLNPILTTVIKCLQENLLSGRIYIAPRQPSPIYSPTHSMMD